MKLGFGLYRHLLDADNFRFAKQCGATHLVVHLVDYFKDSRNNPARDQPTGGNEGWGNAGDPDRPWTYEQLRDLKRAVNAEGLELEAIENFDPAHWYDVLLDGPRKAAQLEQLKTMIRALGRAGIPVMGYNFSIAGVACRTKGPYARGGAEAVGMETADQTPIPNGMVWNMVYDRHAGPGNVPYFPHDELWRRLGDFLRAILPVAEEAGVKLALHPDDPPVEVLRNSPRLVWKPELYQRLLDLNSSPANTLEYCVGTVAEMVDGDVYQATEYYARQQRIGYVHLRNIRGKVPTYKETFIDDGDVDVRRIIEILARQRYDGVIIPDHAPQLQCAAPWHAGMAFAMGYLRACLQDVAR